MEFQVPLFSFFRNQSHIDGTAQASCHFVSKHLEEITSRGMQA